MGAGHSAEGEAGAYSSDPPARDRKKHQQKRRRHSVDSVASCSSQNHVDRIRTHNFSAASCKDDADFGSIKTSLFRRSSSNSEIQQKRPESVTSNASSTRSRLRELVERKSSYEEKSICPAAGDIQYFENPSENLDFSLPRSEGKKTDERPKKRKLSKSKDKDKEKDLCESKNKKHEKYQSKLAEYYKLPVQLPQDEFYQHLTRSQAAEELIQKRFSNISTEFSGSYGRLCKHKESEGSNLRRSRSLAVIREETFTDLQVPNSAKNKRSQLIPRARLFDKPCFKDRLPGRAKYQTKEEVLESIYIDSTASCFGDISAQKNNDNQSDKASESKQDKEDTVSHHESNHSRSISGSWPNLADDVKHTEGSLGHSRNPSEIDSLDSNYVRKHYNFDAHAKSYKDSSPESERSVISRNGSKQLYATTDDLDTESEPHDISPNRTPVPFLCENEDQCAIENSTSEENILCDEKPFYDEVHEPCNKSETKSNRCSESKNRTKDTNQSDSRSLVSETDGTISSPESITSYISISIASSTDKSHKLEYLANSLAEKIDEYCESQYQENVSISKTVASENNQEPDPIYTRVNKKRSYSELKRDSYLSQSGNIYTESPKKTSSEIYISNTYIENEDYCERLDPRLCASTKNITTEPFVTTLIENQYYSLPDINISKCLRKSERIDAQLREEDPEDIPCENTYEVAHSHFREILSSKANNTYGKLIQTNVNSRQVKTASTSYSAEYSEPIQDFSKLEDDLKSIITVDSSNADDKEYYRSDCHQTEREINEIENTIRNTKVITKSESLKLQNNYKPHVRLSKSFSNDNLKPGGQLNKPKVGIKKHYSLRQRDPTDVDINRIPSPNTFAKNYKKCYEPKLNVHKNCEEVRTKQLISRIQSFKTSVDSNISIIPLSGHQTLVIDPPNYKSTKEAYNSVPVDCKPNIITPKDGTSNNTSDCKEVTPLKKRTNSIVDTSSFVTPKDPFVTIKLNKVIKTTIPKLSKEAGYKISSVQYKFEKPPPRLIIKDSKNNKNNLQIPVKNSTCNKQNMTRPQILQVVDSKTKKLNESEKHESVSTENIDNHSQNSNNNLPEFKIESVKEKLNKAIKTDIEYQEKLHSVKNYWSKLIEKTPEKEMHKKSDLNIKQEEKENQIEIKNETQNIESIDTTVEKMSPEISVGTIIKSIESVKIVDSIRKLSQTKLHLWKDETEKVKSDSEIEETSVKKIVKNCELSAQKDITSTINHLKTRTNPEWSRETPEIEIVELSSNDNHNQKTQATLIKAKDYEKGCDEFDHVRYKVMKSDLFKNSMIANYRKEAQFDGLLQYLQDYSFQELLVNNNIVIIEPVRTKIDPPQKKNSLETFKIASNLLKKSEGNLTQCEKAKNAVRRHFFYHPIRVNKEIIEEELPNPDTVKKVRNLFEDTLKMKSPMTHDPPLIDDLGLTRRATSYRNLNEDLKGNIAGIRKKVLRHLTIDTNFGHKKWDNVSMSSGVSSGDLSSNNEYETDALSPYSQKNLKENTYSSSDEYLCDSINDFCCESQYVSPDILKKIRECGTSITYYGGKVLNSKTGSIVSPMTKAIMEEIKGLQKNCSRDCYSCQTKCRGEKCSCLISDKHNQIRAENKQTSSTSSDSGNIDQDKKSECFPGFKFKLVKSNSCSSRLELTGTDDLKNARNRYRKKLDDPPLIYDDENSVKTKICRLESYNKGFVDTPFETKYDDDKILPKALISPMKIDTEKKIVEVKPQPNLNIKREQLRTQINKTDASKESLNGKHTPEQLTAFEKKYYYVNDTPEQTRSSTGKFGEMEFEEFEVLDAPFYDNMNSNKITK